MKPALATALCWFILCNRARAAEPPPRRYEAGPLSTADFAATPPADRGISLASTHTGLEYKLDYRSLTGPRGARVVATKLEVMAMLYPARSWNAAQDDARLLDHEQGHFDITQKHARIWQPQAARKIAQQALTGQGATLDAAQKALKEQVEAELRSVNKAWEAEQVLYDKETDHGRHRDNQARWRQRLDRELKRKL